MRDHALLTAIVGIGLLPVAAAEPADPSASPLRSFIERHRADAGTLERLHSIDFSPGHTARLRQFLENQREALGRIDFAALDAAGRIDWVLMRHHLEAAQRELGHAAEKSAEAAELVPFAADIIALEEERRLRRAQDPEACAARLAAVPRQIGELRATLQQRLKEKAAPSATVAVRAAGQADQLRDALRAWDTFYAGYDPAFTWWTKAPVAAADKALEDWAWFLREQVAGYQKDADPPLVGDPIGRGALLDALREEMIPYSPEELLQIAEREAAWCRGEMKRAADDLGCDGDWPRALATVSARLRPPGAQPALIRELADEAVAFLEQRELVTIPPLAKECWRMEMMSPERQKVNPYFTGGEVISVAYPTDGMSHEDKLMGLRGNNEHFCRATVHHELIPGHHLQGFMAQRWSTHRGLFRTPFLIEGWALHWEMLLWDLGFARSAEDRVGMLFWRSHRCARIIFSLKFHLGQMTADQAVEYLVTQVGHERRNATAEVRRSIGGDYGPLYQAAYMLGGLQLRALHRELVASGKMTQRQFHDAVLREGPIPIEMIRASLTGQELTPDFATQWRFAGE